MNNNNNTIKETLIEYNVVVPKYFINCIKRDNWTDMEKRWKTVEKYYKIVCGEAEGQFPRQIVYEFLGKCDRT